MTTKLSAMLAGFAVLLSAATSFARESTWDQAHPRRAEVNGRIENQLERIGAGVREGELTLRQAARLHAEDRAIRREECTMAARHGGHITKREQRVLNRQENALSGRIRRERVRS
jgi:hypothetical protein